MQGLIQQKKLDFNWEKGAQFIILDQKIVTQGGPQITIIESEQITKYIFVAIFQYYIHTMLLIWSKHWSWVYW